MFRICLQDGFQMTFPNGVVVSVQFGAMHYCEARDVDALLNRAPGMPLMKGSHQSPDAEVGIFLDGKPGDTWRSRVWLTKQWRPDLLDDVAGWLTPVDVLDALARAAKKKVAIYAPQEPTGVGRHRLARRST